MVESKVEILEVTAVWERKGHNRSHAIELSEAIHPL